MIHSLAVTAAQRPEVLERILRVARHRGFTVMQMQMRLEEDNVSLDIKVDSERAIELLTNQLSKLIDHLPSKQSHKQSPPVRRMHHIRT